MSSEGYFINQFFVTHTNHRSDEWGGSYENRMRLPVEIGSRLREAVGHDVIIIHRPSVPAWPLARGQCSNGKILFQSPFMLAMVQPRRGPSSRPRSSRPMGEPRS